MFVDVEPDSGNLDANLVESAITPRTKAIIPVHLYGLMCDMRTLKTIADRHGLVLIEDAGRCMVLMGWKRAADRLLSLIGLPAFAKVPPTRQGRAGGSDVCSTHPNRAARLTIDHWLRARETAVTTGCTKDALAGGRGAQSVRRRIIPKAGFSHPGATAFQARSATNSGGARIGLAERLMRVTSELRIAK